MIEQQQHCGLLEDDMAWATPHFDHSEVDSAGRDLAASRNLDHARTVVNNWRSCHSFPLNTIQVGLRQKVRGLDDAVVAQRLKRLSSIMSKLKLREWIRLSNMQDIGGCRAIVGSVEEVEHIVDLFKRSRARHLLVKEDDYILCPRASGYRSHHLVYGYVSDKNDIYDGNRIEVQIRSKLQHAWATAVETVGAFTKQALKSSVGQKRWLRFFSLMGSVVADREGTALVPETPTRIASLISEIKKLAETLRVVDRLSLYQTTVRTEDDFDARYYLMVLDTKEKEVRITGFRKNRARRAEEAYAKIEKDTAHKPFIDSVLVSVDSLKDLRRAYPNYFLDTEVFKELVQETIG